MIPQRADMVLERCTNAVATPFGVTGALQNTLNVIEFDKQSCCDFTLFATYFFEHLFNLYCLFVIYLFKLFFRALHLTEIKMLY